MSDFSDLGKFIALAGAALLILGGLLWLMGKVPLLGHLPGDIRLQRGNVSCFFPLTTMIIVSVLLSLVLNIVIRLLRK
jgi:hypothetical protein